MFTADMVTGENLGTEPPVWAPAEASVSASLHAADTV
jgi:hypothetical protein